MASRVQGLQRDGGEFGSTGVDDFMDGIVLRAARDAFVAKWIKRKYTGSNKKIIFALCIRYKPVPFTPFHMGPGILLKAVLQGSFSLMVFGWAQIIMDVQPLIVLLSGEGHLHGFTHTYLGATLIGAVSAITGKHAAELDFE